MLQFLKFFIGFIIFIIFLLLINISFFSGEKNNGLDNIKFNYNLSGSYLNKINYLDNVYSYQDSDIEIKDENGEIEIILVEGNYILDLNDISKKYIVKGNGFEIDVKGIGDIYLYIEQDKNLIFSLNSSFSLNFLDKDSNLVNSYFMYPHEWIKFNPKLNFIYKNSDLYRIRTTTKNGYFKYNLNLILEDKEEFERLLGEENIKLLEDYIKTQKVIYDNNNIIYKKIFGLKEKKFPFGEYINKYKRYFINDSKKAVFIQNIIYNDLISLINEETKNKDLLNKIDKELLELKNIDENRYNELKEFTKNIYKVFMLSNNISDLNKLDNFLYLVNKNIEPSLIKNYLLLHDIYFSYDFLNSRKFINYFNKFLKTYIKNSGIIEKNENLTLNKKEKLIEIESFLFFLREYIKSYLFSNSLENFDSQIKILSVYINLNKMIYFNENTQEKKIKTSLRENKNLLYKLENFLRSTLFLEKREKDTNLLIINTNKINTNYNNLLLLEKQINTIMSLSSNIYGKEILKEYENLDFKIREYFSAIKNYDNYKLNYDKEFNKLYNTKGLGEKKSKEYSVDEIFNYFSQFNGIEFNKNNISKKNKSFYINNFSINNKKYSVIFYPYLGNKIEIIGEEGKKISYNLDESQKLLEKRYIGAKAEKRHKYDFKNFFVEKFKDNIYSINKDWDTICFLQNKKLDPVSRTKCIDFEKDSDVISVFKKDKLLNQEFIILKDFFFAKYDNIFVKNVNGKYDIELKNIKAKIKVKQDFNFKIYDIYFNSKYDFKNHLFYDISFKLEIDNRELFNGNYIKLKYKKIKIKELKNFMENYLNNIDYLNNIYSYLDLNLNFSNIEIENIFGKIYFRFNSNNKNIVIKVEKDKIISIIVNNVSILDNSININELKNYIDKLK